MTRFDRDSGNRLFRSVLRRQSHLQSPIRGNNAPMDTVQPVEQEDDAEELSVDGMPNQENHPPGTPSTKTPSKPTTKPTPKPTPKLTTDDPFGGSCRVAEVGSFQKRQSPALTRIKSKLVLQAQRFAIFTSPEFKRRLYEDTGVPRERDATASPFGLLRTTLNPQYRDRQLGNVWEITDGWSTKEELRRELERFAGDSYNRDMRKGRYSVGRSKLAHSMTVGSGGSGCIGGSGSTALRRSERIRAAQVQPPAPKLAPFTRKRPTPPTRTSQRITRRSSRSKLNAKK